MSKVTRYFILIPLKLSFILISYFALTHSNLALAQKHKDNLFFASLPLLFHAAYHYSTKQHNDFVYDSVSDRHDLYRKELYRKELYRKDVYRKEVDINQSVAIEFFEEDSVPKIGDDEPESWKSIDNLVPITELTLLVEEASDDKPDHNFPEDNEGFSAFLYEETLSALHFMEQQERQECLKPGFEAREEAYNEDIRYNLRKDKWLTQVVEDELVYRLIVFCQDTYRFSPSEQPATAGSDLIEVDVVGDVDSTNICSICSHVANKPSIACNQQHMACEACLQESVGRYSNCPFCRVDSEVCNIQPFPYVQRKVNRLKVYCPNKTKGCPATPDISDIKAHYLRCEYVLSTCERCKQEVLKVNLETHSQRCYSLEAIDYPQILIDKTVDETEGETIQSLTQKVIELQDKMSTIEWTLSDVLEEQIRSEPQESRQDKHSGASVAAMSLEPETLSIFPHKLIPRYKPKDIFDIFLNDKLLGSSVRITANNMHDLLNETKQTISKEFRAGNYYLKLFITKDEINVLCSIRVTCDKDVGYADISVEVDVYRTEDRLYRSPKIYDEQKLRFSCQKIKRGITSWVFPLFRITERQLFTQSDGCCYIKLTGSFEF